MRKGQALKIMREELASAGHDAPYDFTVNDEKREDAATLSWWYSNVDDGAGETPRNRAYFRAYVRIAADDGPIGPGAPLPAQGLRLQPKGRLWMDKYVIRKMHQLGLLAFEEQPAGMFEPAFVLTAFGFERFSQ